LYTTLQKIRGRPRDAEQRRPHFSPTTTGTPSFLADTRDGQGAWKRKTTPTDAATRAPAREKDFLVEGSLPSGKIGLKSPSKSIPVECRTFPGTFLPSLPPPLSLPIYIYIIYYRYILYSPTGGYTRQPEHLTCRMETNINSVQQCPTQRRRGERANEHIISN